MPNLHSHAFQRAMAGMTERRGPGDDSFWTWRTLMYRFLDAADPRRRRGDRRPRPGRDAGGRATPASPSSTTCTTSPAATPYADPAELAHRIAAAAADDRHRPDAAARALQLRRRGRAPPLAGGQRRFGNDLDGFLRAARGSGPAPRRRRRPRRRAALAPGDDAGPARGARRGPARRPAAHPRRRAGAGGRGRSRPGSAPAPSTSSSTTSASARAGASSTPRR